MSVPRALHHPDLLAAAWAGVGPRAWPAFAETGRPGGAMGLPVAAVQQRICLRLRGDGGDRDRIRALLQRIDALNHDGLGVAGWLGYELGVALEDIPLPRPEAGGPPDAELVVFAPESLRSLPLTPLAARAATAAAATQAVQRPPPELARQRGAWLAAVSAALERIQAGGFYQVNLSVCFDVPAAGVAQLPLITALAAILQSQPVSLAMVFEGQNYRLLSGSMERFLALADGQVSSRPIKGTAARGVGAADEALRAGLLGSAKERAENTMIVDMVRNDLGRVCAPGSVRVTELLTCEPYATLWHLESDVVGRVRGGMAGLLEATLPPASVTGCPKVAAMGFIAAAEARRRGAYCGALGVSLPGGRADWSVGIRQLTLLNGSARISVGSGIVADSDPDAEWRETCLKAAASLAWLQQLIRLRSAEGGARAVSKGAGS